MPGSAKRQLDDEGAGDQRPDVDAGRRQQREARRPEGVAPHDPTARQALGAGHGDEVLLEGADEVGAQQSVVDGDRTGRDGHRRQDHLVDVGGGALGERGVPGGREPAEADGEDRHQDGGDHEGRQGQQAEGRRSWRCCPGAGWACARSTRARGMATAKAITWEMMISSRSTGNPVSDDVGHRLVVEVGRAQVAVEHRSEPGEVLVPQREVESQLLEEDRPGWRPCRWPRGCCSVGSPGSRWTSRKVEHGDDEGHHDQLEELAGSRYLVMGRRAVRSPVPLPGEPDLGRVRRCPRRRHTAAPRSGRVGLAKFCTWSTATSEKMYCSSQR